MESGRSTDAAEQGILPMHSAPSLFAADQRGGSDSFAINDCITHAFASDKRWQQAFAADCRFRSGWLTELEPNYREVYKHEMAKDVVLTGELLPQ